MKTLDPCETDSFDVVVPPFSADKLNIELEMFDGTDKFIGNSDNDITPTAPNTKVTWTRNKIVTIALNVSTFETPDYAYLAQGPVFNRLIDSLISNNGNTATGIIFNPSWSEGVPPADYDQDDLDDDPQHWAGWVIVSADDSPIKIYAKLDGTTIQILSKANYMYAQANSSGMFQNLTTITGINWAVDPVNGYGFQTEDVTDMSYMFAGCTRLTTIQGLEKSNFTNVTNMSHMFENCTGYIQTISMNPVNTHNLLDTGMVAMFKGCSALQGINLSTFTTDHVTSMRDFANGCKASEIHIDNFSISAGTELTGAFVNVGPTWDGATYNIYCTGAVYAILSTQDATVIDLNKARFPNQAK